MIQARKIGLDQPLGSSSGSRLQDPLAVTPRCKKGFSLIELLVVLTIVSLLTSMLMVAVGLVRSAARGVVCASNMRQIAISLQTYADDWQGLYPVYQQPDNSLPIWGMWYGTVRSYLPIGRVYMCADSPRVKAGGFNLQAPDSNWAGQLDVMGSSYGMSAWASTAGSTWLTDGGRAMNPAAMKGIATTILLGEAMRQQQDGTLCSGAQVDWPWHLNCGAAGPVDPRNPRPGLWNYATWRISHRGRSNLVYYDLHTGSGNWDETNPSHTATGPGNQWAGIL